MSASSVQITSAGGTRMATNSYTEGGVTVNDQKILIGEHYFPFYVCPNGAGLSVAVANDHVFQLMAGSSLNVYVRRIVVYQAAVVTSAAIQQMALFSLSTAGTGGGVQTVRALDSTDAAAGATVMTLPTVKGTEVGRFWLGSFSLMQTAPTAGQALLMYDIDFEKLHGKAHRIPSGVTNGLALKTLTGTAGAQVYADVWFSELSF